MTPDDADLDDGLPLSLEEEAEMQAEIELALDPFRKIAPPSLIPILRENLEHTLRTHPYPRQLLRAFANRKPEMVSGERSIDGSEERDRNVGGKGGA